jgi:hypothetical protein
MEKPMKHRNRLPLRSLISGAAALLLLGTATPRAHAQHSLVDWGINEFSNLDGSPPAGPFKAVAAGRYHSVAIRMDGTLVTWGEASHLGSFLADDTPPGTFVDVAAGTAHCVALRTDGTLVSWGEDSFALVTGTPVGTFTDVATGDDHSIAIRSDGTIATWGDNHKGQVSGAPGGTFVAVAGGNEHSVAIRTDGTIVSWGDNTFGQVSGTPAGTFRAVAAGGFHSVAIRMDGTLLSWGGTLHGYNFYNTVVDTPSGSFIAVEAGHLHSVAIRADGSLVAWGYDQNGAIQDCPGGTFSAVAAGHYHNVAIGAPDNQPPTAINDFYGMDQAASLTVSSPGLLANDSDPDDDPLTVTLVTGPAHAESFHLSPDGSFYYTPPLYFVGEDTFTYRVNDGSADSEIATVRITVSQPGSQGFITGGGKFLQEGRKCTFGFIARVQGSGVQGQLEFQDHGAGLELHSEAVEWVYSPDPAEGYFSGTCSVDGAPGYRFFVQVRDLGQPGGNDEFAIWVLDPFGNPIYFAAGSLSGGNVVIHGN